jgi:hypothetical protein
MGMKRGFRWPVIAVMAAVIPILAFLVIFAYANSGTAYSQARLSHVIALINEGQVRSARLVGYHLIQVTTNGSHPQHLEASWAGGQGPALARQLRQDHNWGKLPHVWIVAATGSLLSSIAGTLAGILPYAVVILIIAAIFVSIMLLLFRRRPPA